MTFSRRLARLEATSAAPVAAAPAQPEPPPAPPSPARAKLNELRDQLQALLTRNDGAAGKALRGTAPPAVSQRLRQRQLQQLPFVRREQRGGSLWQRIERLTGAHRIGQVRLDQLERAQPAVLAELALDQRVALSTPETWLFLDTETTGLAGAGTLAFLVGMASWDPEQGALLEQLLLFEPSHERALLERVQERFQAASLIVSFNGKSFDQPLLDGRMLLHRLPRLPQRPHLDLLHVARRLHRDRLGRCNLKRLESQVLGFERGPDIDGAQVAAVYAHFLRSADTSGIQAVVAHNLWDVQSMLGLVGLYGQRAPALHAEDLAGLARTLRRAGATLEAERAAQAACERGGGVDALRVRAELAKARGDALAAIRDLEQLCAQVDDPAGRLELAKLYEHRLRCPERALEWLARGTTESDEADARRRARLARKLQLC
ncbi:MAG TPA: ribonuclease H-like domain-containing protein [Polyangiaceae bacterium]|nr:ribonuclease H-like domain-containing protein [Polyangiaceae bacterium]